MTLCSVNVGLPRDVSWRGTTVTTSIFKEPVQGRVALRTLNLDGDRQADLSVHGGEHKAVYCYALQHYAYWRRELDDASLPIGAFGENFTIDDFDEQSICIGDRLTVGSAQLVVTQPRLPCHKLALRFQSLDMVKRFLASRRTGFYVAVTQEGDVGAGDKLAMIARDPEAVSIADITRLYVARDYSDADAALAQRALQVRALPASWKEHLRERVNR